MNPEKNSPKKIDLEKIKKSLGYEQLTKIKYECDLLNVSIDDLMRLAPFLFNDNVTAANTEVIKPTHIKRRKYEDDNEYDSYYPEYTGNGYTGD